MESLIKSIIKRTAIFLSLFIVFIEFSLISKVYVQDIKKPKFEFSGELTRFKEDCESVFNRLYHEENNKYRKCQTVKASFASIRIREVIEMFKNDCTYSLEKINNFKNACLEIENKITLKVGNKINPEEVKDKIYIINDFDNSKKKYLNDMILSALFEKMIMNWLIV